MNNKILAEQNLLESYLFGAVASQFWMLQPSLHPMVKRLGKRI